MGITRYFTFSLHNPSGRQFAWNLVCATDCEWCLDTIRNSCHLVSPQNIQIQGPFLIKIPIFKGTTQTRDNITHLHVMPYIQLRVPQPPGLDCVQVMEVIYTFSVLLFWACYGFDYKAVRSPLWAALSGQTCVSQSKSMPNSGVFLVWNCQAPCHCLRQYWPRSMLPYGVTRPQWLKFILQFLCMSSMYFNNSYDKPVT